MTTGTKSDRPLADMMLDAWDFATVLQNEQRVPGTDLSYLKHLGMVAMEIYSTHAISRSQSRTGDMLCNPA